MKINESKAKIIAFSFLALCLCIISCEKDTLPSVFAPTISTGSVEGIHRNGVQTVFGCVNNPQSHVFEEYGIEYSLYQSFAEADRVKGTEMDEKGKFSVSIEGLEAGEVYYYRTYVFGGHNTIYGEASSFTTTDISAPLFSEETEISNITFTSFDVKATLVDDGGAKVGVQMRSFLYIPAENDVVDLVRSTPNVIVKDVDDFETTIDNLPIGTRYAIRPMAVSGGGTGYGAIAYVTTAPDIAQLSACEFLDTTDHSVVASARILATGVYPIEEVGFCYSSTNNAPTLQDSIVCAELDSADFRATLSALCSFTTYNVCAYAKDTQGKVFYSDVNQFRTKKEAITITTGEASEITYSKATLSGIVRYAEQPVDCGFIYGVSEDLSATNGVMLSTKSSGDYTIIASGLSENTTYYYRAYALEDGEYKYGDVLSFVTKHGIIVTTGDASEITHCQATLSGTVLNAEQPVDCGVIYGVSEDLSATNGVIVSTKSDGGYTIDVSPLSENTTYYYRAYALVDGEYKYGEVLSFKTKSVTVTTGEASDITYNQANLSGTVLNVEQPIDCGFIYGASEDLSATNGVMLSTKSSGDYTISVSGLSENTTYYYRAYVLVGGEYKYGDVLLFKTKSVTVSTGDASEITYNQATLNGTILNVEQAVDCGFIYGVSEDLSATNGVMISTKSSGDYKISVSDLRESTTYYYRAYVLVDGVCRYGEVLSFMTKSVTITTGDASEITYNQATLNGTILNVEQAVECGFIYGHSKDLSVTNGVMISTKSSGDYKISVSGLRESTTYYYRAYVLVDGVCRYGEVLSFMTKSIAITTGEASDITTTKATLSGTVLNVGQPIDCGIVYSLSDYYLSVTNGVMISTKSSGDYKICVSGLSENTTYYYRAYVLVDGVYMYGNVLSFMTKNITVTTGVASAIDISRATLSGTVLNAEQPVDCGIIYGDSKDLSATNGIMLSTRSRGDYKISVSGLSENTSYYYRAYVLVDGEYKYGDVFSFTTFDTKHEAVDLGLSVKWANCNVGADSPTDYGGYYAWGETEEKAKYDWSTYKWCKGSESSLTKYCTNSSKGAVDKKTILDKEDDVAHVKWGGSWRMPTKAEVEELNSKCTWTWTSQNDIKGYKVTGPNGNSIFLPAAGSRKGTSLERCGSIGHYWSATLSGNDEAVYLGFYDGTHTWDDSNRSYGRNVRPVTDK